MSAAKIKTIPSRVHKPHRVPIKTSIFYFSNISVKNQPNFTMFGAHIWPTFLTVSAVLLV